LVAEDQICRIDGVAHSLQCLSQILTGRPLELFEFQGHESIPRSERIVNWDLLLSRVRSEDLLWNRLGRVGHRTGLFEMLGVVISPTVAGFSVTKNVSRVGLASLFRHDLSHHPREIGPLYRSLRQKYDYPINLVAKVGDFRHHVRGPVERLSDGEARAVMEECGYRDLIGAVDQSITGMFQVVEQLLARYPVDVLLLHTGYLDLLLHFYYERPEEAELMHLLDGLFRGLKQLLGFDEVLAFSDHGMTLSSPHAAGRFLHRTYHRPASAVLLASGTGVERHFTAHPPKDLTAVYHGVTGAMEGGAPREPGSPATAADAGELLQQLQEILAGRDQLLVDLDGRVSDEVVALEEGREEQIELAQGLERALARKNAEVAELRQSLARIKAARSPGLLRAVATLLQRGK
jgi:hypothetical protein